MDEKTVNKYFDSSEELMKDEFVKLAIETKLTEFNVGEGVFSKSTPTPTVKTNQVEEKVKEKEKEYKGFLCCISSNYVSSPPLQRNSEDEERKRKIEKAFKKFDLDGDGFLSWEEFLKIGLDVDAAERIFKACDNETEGKITFDQFHNIVTKKYPTAS